MTRRLAGVVAALLVTGCSVPFVGSSAPAYGFITLTDDGNTLTGGSSDVPPTLDLEMQAQVAFQQQDVNATLDGRTLSLQLQGAALTARTAPMPLGSSHHLNITIAGRADAISLDFSVIPPTEVMLAAHIDPNDGMVVDGVFDDAPSQAAVSAVLPGATLVWKDPLHLRVTWQGSPPGSVELPATIPTGRGSHLAAPIGINLAGMSSGELRRVTVPVAPPVSGTTLVAFVQNTADSNSSLAHHQSVLNWVVATGWTAEADGSILGTPDEVAVPRAEAAHLPVWPSLSNDITNPTSTTTLLSTPAAVSQLIGTVVNSAVDGGFPGINLDFESMPPSDKDLFTAFVRALASALHAKNVQLMVDVVPHDTSGVNQFSAAYDVPAIGSAADFVDLLAYDEHANGSAPGPVAGLDWDQSVLAATLPGLNPAHTFLGIPLYSRSWSGGSGPGGAYLEQVPAALSVPGARVGYDFNAQTPVVVTPNDASETYFDDADSLARKIALAHQEKLAGVVAWRLGFEDPAFWGLFG